MTTHTTIIAEAGVNHNGRLDLALKLVDAAAAAGADYVKFQTFDAQAQVTACAATADYQKRQCGDTQLEMLKGLELAPADFYEIKARCEKQNIGFLSTGFDIGSLDTLMKIGMDYIKIPSGEITHKALIRHASTFGKPVIVSTGACCLADIEAALSVLLKNLVRDQIILLHCTTEYPAPLADVNLAAIQTLGRVFKTKVGYSDHTLGIEIPVAAVALGASVIEKHFTLDTSMEGPDHQASLNPDELQKMVRGIRHIEQALGDGIKEVKPSEKKNRQLVRKSLVARTPIKAGDIFTSENVIAKRPADGLSPMLYDQVIGQKADKNYDVDDKLEWGVLPASAQTTIDS